LGLKNKVESRAFVVKCYEAGLHEQKKQIKKLRHKLSRRKKMIFKLCMKGMYVFVWVYSMVICVDCRLLQYDVLSVKMFIQVSLEVQIS
jgi:hypothetical protein